MTEDEFKQEMEQLRESRATVEPVEEDRADRRWRLGADRLLGHRLKATKKRLRLPARTRWLRWAARTRWRHSPRHCGAPRPGSNSVSAAYPAEYPEAKLAGKTVDYDIDVKAIKKRTLPELNDDFAKEMGQYENVAQLENGVREHIGNRKRRSVEGETKDRLMAALIERFPFPVPESLVQEQVDARLERGLRALAAQGMQTEQMRQAGLWTVARGTAGQRHCRGEGEPAAGKDCGTKRMWKLATRNWTAKFRWRHFRAASRWKHCVLV